jgi:PAS domain S-box-containing protein
MPVQEQTATARRRETAPLAARVVSIAALALVYLIAAKLGLKLALVNSYATAVWPPTGMALAALLLWGSELWPGILAGAFLANVTTGGTLSSASVLASLAIACGNTLEALWGAHLVRRFARGLQAFEHARDVFKFAALAALASTTASATIGVMALWLAGLARAPNAFAVWINWWVGDMGGDLLVAPVLILWGTDWRWRWNWDRSSEAALVVGAHFTLSAMAFTPLLFPGYPAHLGLAVLCLPGLLWAAFSFGQRETAALVLLTSAIAVWGWVHGIVSASLPPVDVLLELQVYLAITSVAMLAVAAEVAQRRRQEQELQLQAEALRRQAQVLDYAHVLLCDLDDRIILWNPGAERLYGFSRAEALGRIAHELLQTRHPEPFEQIRARIFTHGSWQGEVEHRTREGRRIVVASLQVLHRDAHGRPEAILEVNNDITELKRVEEARLQLAAIVESSDDAIFSRSPDGRITSWNRGAERIFGYPAAEALGQPVTMLTPPGYEAEIVEIMERIQRGELVEHFETKRQRKDGVIIDASVTASAIKDQAGEITGTSFVARDITERNRLEEQFRQAQKMESIGLLAGGIAHDFNNLLVGILGNACLAQEMLPAPHPAAAPLQDVVEASEATAALVRQLLAFAGKGQFSVEPVRLGQAVAGITRLLQSSIPKTIDLRFNLAPDVPPVAADPSQIQQVVMNLIINAAEAIGARPGRIAVAVRARELDGSFLHAAPAGPPIRPGRYVVLEVQDDGPGMDEDTRARIFDPFFSTKFAGRGLGLAAVMGIVRAHKGAIQVVSAPGQGSTFEVLLPAMSGSE